MFRPINTYTKKKKDLTQINMIFYFKTGKKGLERHGPSGRALAWQMQDPEFKHQYHLIF
jgi:hypothetical protein